MIASPQNDSQRMVVAKVRFTPGARTAWHSHSNGQTRHITEGIGLAQSRGGELFEVHPGQTEIKEAIIHLAFYTGWPKAITAITIAKDTFTD